MLTIVIEWPHKGVEALIVNLQFLGDVDGELVVAVENFPFTSGETIASADGAARAVADLVDGFVRAGLSVFTLDALLAVLVLPADRVESVHWLTSSVVVQLVATDQAVAPVRKVLCVVEVWPSKALIL